eukprot:bmy_01884T0
MRSRRRDARRLRPEKRRGRRGRSPLGRSDAPPPRLRPGAWGWRLPASSGAVRTRAAEPLSWGATGKCCGRARASRGGWKPWSDGRAVGTSGGRADPRGSDSPSPPFPRYREELPAAIEGRAEKHVTRDELEQLLAWKLARGPPAVTPDPTWPPRGRFRPRLQRLVTANSPELVVQRSAAAFRLLPVVNAAVTELCALRGVGPAIASRSASGCGPLNRVETALWIWAVRQKLCPDLLPDLSPSLATPEDTRPAKKHRTHAY